MRWVLKRLLRKHTTNPVRNEVVEQQSLPTARPIRPEWERVLTSSLEQNCIAPSDEVILCSFDLYRDDLFGPFLERRHQMADLYAEISADIAALQALAPDLVERAMSRHSFEFYQSIDHKEVH